MAIVRLLLGLLAFSGFNVASPLAKRQKSSLKPTDEGILNYALTLEHLEAALYRQGVANFTKEDFTAVGFSSKVYSQIETIAKHEASHVSYLTKIIQSLNGAPIPECRYDFNTTTPSAFLHTASILEGVGVSAYIGALEFINKTSYLTAAGTILSVEARHSTYLRETVLGLDPFPMTYDIPLTFDSVHTLALPFFVSCPVYEGSFPAFAGIEPFPALTYQNYTYPIATNDTVTLFTETVALQPKNNETALYAAWATHSKPGIVFAEAVNCSETRFDVKVPKGISGQSYVFLTACNGTFSEDAILAGPALLEIGD